MKIYYLGPEGTFTELGAEILEKKIGRKSKITPVNSVEEIARLLKLPRPLTKDMKAYCHAHEHMSSTSEKDGKYAKSLREIANTFRAPLPNRDIGIMAYDNAVNSTVLRNLDIIYRNGLGIMDMVRVPVSFAMGIHRKSSGGNVVFSHEFGLAQCSEFLRKNYPDAVKKEVSSTSEGIQAVREFKSGLAIARKDALEKAGMRIVADDIGNRTEDGTQNYTDMFVVSATGKSPSKNDSLTMIAVTPHFDRPGLLGEILHKHIGKLGINVTNIHSRRAIGDVGPINYGKPLMFYLELEANPKEQRFRRCIYELSDLLNHNGKEVVRVLGSYPKISFRLNALF